MEVTAPSSVEEALDHLQLGNARLVAGGSALQLEWAKGFAKPRHLVDISRIAGLKGISQTQTGLRIGATTPLDEILQHADIAEKLPMLRMATAKVAAPSVRNLATLGGNIAGRTGCVIPALLCLDAWLDIATGDGVSAKSLAEWLDTPARHDEMTIAIGLSTIGQGGRHFFRKIGLRAAFTPSVINVAGQLDVQPSGLVADAALAVGGGVVPPRRLSEAEAILKGSPIEAIDWQRLHACLMETIIAPDDAMRSGDYRRRAGANAIVHALGGSLEFSSIAQARHAVPIRMHLPEEIALDRTANPDRWHIRPDIEAKVAGRLAYLTDQREPAMLVGRILRAGVPHARILSIDTRQAEALPGVVAVVTHRDISGLNAFGIVIQDQPALCQDKVRHRGDPVAAVAAATAEIAEQALSLIRVEYEPLPVVDSPEAALAPDAPVVHASGNLQRELHFGRGDIAAGFAARHIVEETYVTPRQMHGFMETEGGYAFVDEAGTLNMFAGGQHGGRDRLQLSRILAMPEEKIRVVTSPTGGAFGGKDELTVQPALALLALKSGRPVRLQLSRAESVLAGQKRNPMTIRMRTGIDADGRLVAQQVEVLADAGAYASLGPGVLETALEHAAGPYVIENVQTHGRLAYTNNGVCGAFRGFGANQMTYAIECQMDRLASLCDLSPFEIRRRNLRQAGMPGYLGQTVAPTERSDEMLATAEGSALWHAPQGRSMDGEWIIGTGMALNYQGNGLGSVVPDPSGGRLCLTRDGFIEGGFGLDEIGQGLLSLIKATVSRELGCSRDDVSTATGDTRLAPESGSTTASRGTSVVWASTRMAAPEFSRQMRLAAGTLLNRDPETLTLGVGGMVERGSNSGDIIISYKTLAQALDEKALPSVTVAYEFPKNDYSAGNARLIFAFGAALARVAVSSVTGEVRVLDLHQHSAAGPVMDMAAYLGQLEGGAIQGLGFTLSEDMPMPDAAHTHTNLDTYMMPGIQDAPGAMQAFALESLDPADDLGPRGSGELGIGAVTPAIANAIFAATGYLPAVTPFSPETILTALEVGQ